MSDTFETEMTKLRGDVAAQGTIIASATEAFRGLAAQLVAAEAAAKNAGATDAQVAAVTNLRVQLEANTASLASAIPANTDMASASPAPAPMPVPAPEPASSTPTTSSVIATAPSSAAETPAPTAVDASALAANQAR